MGIQDEGYSGAILVRPGLEALRDLAAEGQIVAALVYSPDRLSRKYAYQVLLSEELSRCGVGVDLSEGAGGSHAGRPSAGAVSGHDCRIRARPDRRAVSARQEAYGASGRVNVLSGAPFGYRYVKKSDTSAAFYEVMEDEAQSGADGV